MGEQFFEFSTPCGVKATADTSPMDHKDAPKGKMGLVYMLQGGSDASNYDPFATAPKPGEKWVTTSPNVMVVGMAGSLDDISKSLAKPKKPFIMWGGTSYEHIMIPVK